MKKALSKIVFALSISVLVANNAQASATQDSVGCGIGTMVFQNSTGLLYSLLAMTTNTTTFQTVSMTLGLGNCPSGASIRGHIASFIEFNKSQLAIEVAQGKGDHLAALIEMFGVKQSDRQAAISALKANQVAIFSLHSTVAIQDAMGKTLQAYIS